MIIHEDNNAPNNLVRTWYEKSVSMVLRLDWLAILLILVIAASIGLWSRLHSEKDELHDRTQSDANDAYEANRFTLMGVEGATSRDNRITTTISADQILHRNRQSGSIVFYNLNEIYAVNLSLSLDASREPPLQVLVSDIPSFYKLIPFSAKEPSSGDGSTEQNSAEQNSAEQDMVTRIIADGFQMQVTYNAGRVAAISAGRATLMTQDQNIVFERDVAIQDSGGRRLRAPQAIWSSRHEGILFPQGYSEQEPNRNKKQTVAFFQLNQNGTLTKKEKLPAIQLHQDLVDQLENLLWVHLFQKLFGGFQ